ncbi:MAG: hypothetical protein V4568_09690 [Pseudomonadota bacterium]
MQTSNQPLCSPSANINTNGADHFECPAEAERVVDLLWGEHDLDEQYYDMA